MNQATRSHGARLVNAVSWVWVFALAGGAVLQLLVAFWWRLPALLRAVDSLSDLRFVETDIEYYAAPTVVRPKTITKISLSLQCAFFLLVPVYAILVFAFSTVGYIDAPSSVLSAGDFRSSFSCPLIEEDEDGSVLSCQREDESPRDDGQRCVSRPVPKRAACKRADKREGKRKESHEGIEYLQTTYDSPSDESFYNAQPDHPEIPESKPLPAFGTDVLFKKARAVSNRSDRPAPASMAGELRTSDRSCLLYSVSSLFFFPDRKFSAPYW